MNPLVSLIERAERAAAVAETTDAVQVFAMIAEIARYCASGDAPYPRVHADDAAHHAYQLREQIQPRGPRPWIKPERNTVDQDFMEAVKTSADDSIGAIRAAFYRIRHNANPAANRKAWGRALEAASKSGEFNRDGNRLWVAGVEAVGLDDAIASPMADDDRVADREKILDLIRFAGKEGITEGRICDRLRSLRPEVIAGELDELQDAHQIRFEQHSPTGRGRPSKRYFVAGEN